MRNDASEINAALATYHMALVEKGRALDEWMNAARAWTDPANATQRDRIATAEAMYWAADQAWYDAWHVCSLRSGLSEQRP